MTILEWLAQADQRLKGNFESPKFEARKILEEALRIQSAQVIASCEKSLESGQLAELNSWLDRRLQGEPLSYISGRKEFFGRNFKVLKGVLIPRPETEFVIEEAFRKIKDSDELVADLGCGTGCIGLTLAIERPQLKVLCVDASLKAIENTKLNMNEHRLEDRVTVEHQSLPDYCPNQSFDMVLANPPYISPEDLQIEENVRKFEPHMALFSDNNGLHHIKEWAEWSGRNLRPGGRLIMEIGTGQFRDVQSIMNKAGFASIHLVKDYAGHERVVSGVMQWTK